MFYAITWFVVLGLLALWSVSAWAFNSIAAWAVANAGALAGGSAAATLRLPDWLSPWVPPEFAQALTSMLSAFVPAIESLTAWAPALTSGLSVIVWVVWAIGSALLVMLGLALSGTIAMVRRRTAAKTNPSIAARTTA